MADFKAGDVLGERFEVAGVLGRGGMATVYLATDRLRNDKVALKILHDHLADTPSMRARLRREVTAASRIRHPNALVASDLHELNGRLVLSLPLHPGQNLSDYVVAKPRLEAEALVRLGTQIAGALAEAHQHGVVHRDVTPTNVMVDDEGNGALTDFGLARLEDLRSATATGVVGTCGYAAPEVYQGERADPRSDIYSLGALLYFAATGISPFKASNPMGVLKKQLEEDFAPLSKLRPDLPAGLCTTIDAMMAREPAARPQGARETLEALKESLNASAAGQKHESATLGVSGESTSWDATGKASARDYDGTVSFPVGQPPGTVSFPVGQASSTATSTSGQTPGTATSIGAKTAGSVSSAAGQERNNLALAPRPLPTGNWTVILRERANHHQRRQRARARRRGVRLRRRRGRGRSAFENDIAQVINEVKEGFKTIFNIPDDNAPEAALTQAIAHEAGLPAEALVISDTLYERKFRLIESVDVACAYRLEQVARQVGFDVKLHELDPKNPSRPSRRAARIAFGPLIAFAVLIAVMGIDIWPILSVVFGLMILVRLIQGPQQKKVPSFSHLPLAFGHDLRPYLAEGYTHLQIPESNVLPVGAQLEANGVRLDPARARLEANPARTETRTQPASPSARTASGVLGSQPPPRKESLSPANRTPGDRVYAIEERTRQQLDAFERTLQAHKDTLPEVILNDMRSTLEGLRKKTRALGAQSRKIHKDLAETDDEAAAAAAARIETRLTRLETLKGAGQTVDEEDLATLKKGLEAHRRTLEYVETLEARATRITARLLEIGATAAQARRDLVQEKASAQTAPLLVGRLQEEAAAAANALMEVEGYGSRPAASGIKPGSEQGTLEGVPQRSGSKEAPARRVSEETSDARVSEGEDVQESLSEEEERSRQARAQQLNRV